MFKTFFTKKRIIIALIAVVIGGVMFTSYRNKNKPTEYETTTVQKGALVQTVEATGKITSVNDVALRFEIPGILTNVYVKEGATVKKGTLLANVRLTELNASVAQAAANLNQKLAGITPEDRSYYEAAATAAEVSYQDAQVGTVQAYQNLVTTLQATLSKLDDALTQADNILGVDNVFANEDFKYSLSVQNPPLLGAARGQYSFAKKAIQDFKVAVNSLVGTSDQLAVEQVANRGEEALDAVNLLLQGVSDVLRASVPQGALTQTGLDAKKSIIEASRITINTQSNTLVTKRQAIVNAFGTEAAKKAALDQARAQLQSKIATPREVDVASYRAALAQAVAAREKARIVAPADGVISKLGKKVGETVSSADVIVQLLSPHYEIEVDIPETDVPKISLNDTAEITLDAFGEENKFTGQVTAIEPGATTIQDVVYYKVTIALVDTEKPIKPGMTANISINTDARESALFVPQRTVRTKEDGSKFVKVLENGAEKEVAVTIGLRANDSKLEILSGLTENQTVIISVKEKK